MKLRLDKMGRIVVPKALRERFDLRPGDHLDVDVEADGFRIHPATPKPALVEKEGLLVCDSEVPVSAWDTAELLEEERRKRSTQLSGM